jgi:hypothetical protein
MEVVACLCGVALLVPDEWTRWRCAVCQRDMVRAVAAPVPEEPPLSLPPQNEWKSPLEFVKCAIPSCRREAIASAWCSKHADPLRQGASA